MALLRDGSASTPETQAYSLETQLYLHDPQRPASEEATLPYDGVLPWEVRREAALPKMPQPALRAAFLDEDSVLTIGYEHLLRPAAGGQPGRTHDFGADSVQTVAYEAMPAESAFAQAGGRQLVVANTDDYDTLPYEAYPQTQPFQKQVEALPPHEADLETLPHEPFGDVAGCWAAPAPLAPPASATPATPPKLPQATGAALRQKRGGPSGGQARAGRGGRAGGPALVEGPAEEEPQWLKRRRREEPPAAAASAPRWRGQRVIQVEATPPQKPPRLGPRLGLRPAPGRQLTLEESFREKQRNGSAISLDSDD